MLTVSLYRLHTDALDEATLQAIADRIHKTNPNQKVYIYDIERDEGEVEMLKDALHEAHERKLSYQRPEEAQDRAELSQMEA